MGGLRRWEMMCNILSDKVEALTSSNLEDLCTVIVLLHFLPKMSSQHLESGLRLYGPPFVYESLLGFPVMIIRVNYFTYLLSKTALYLYCPVTFSRGYFKEIVGSVRQIYLMICSRAESFHSQMLYQKRAFGEHPYKWKDKSCSGIS